MTEYAAPVKDMMFVLQHVVGVGKLAKAKDLDPPTIETILEEAGKLAGTVLSPLNRPGDKQGSKRQADGSVVTPTGTKDAYAQYRDGGWNGVPFNPDYGGQGLPWAVAFAVQEMWQASNMSFGLCPLLNQAAVEAVENHGSQQQKDTYLEKLISGHWTGTMNLTEPHAGSDLGIIKAKAVKQEDGSYLLQGQKIFITYGEHDLADNIIHMVLARTPGAPEGVKGISLFLVPKFIPDDQGNPATRNDVQCVSLEHKLGIHASPTCVMQYGGNEGAKAWLIGNENEGLKYMFTMMNNARLSVGLQGVAIAERAFQHALDYARTRIQGTKLSDKSGARVAIVEHPDVRRMLLSMKSQIEAGRMLAYEAAVNLDLAREGDAVAQARVDLLTPVVKAWCTDMAVNVASEGVQVFGGMGFIEETGAAQYYRDARILPIYEGTNGIQAQDLAFRKILMNKGAAAQAYFTEADAVLAGLPQDPDFTDMKTSLQASVSSLRQATDHLLKIGATDMDAAAAVSVPYLRAFGVVAGGIMMARAAQAAKSPAVTGSDPKFAQVKILTAQFYADHILPQQKSALETVLRGSRSVNSFKPEMF